MYTNDLFVCSVGPIEMDTSVSHFIHMNTAMFAVATATLLKFEIHARTLKMNLIKLNITKSVE